MIIKSNKYAQNVKMSIFKKKTWFFAYSEKRKRGLSPNSPLFLKNNKSNC